MDPCCYAVPFGYECQLIWLSKHLKDFQKYILILTKLFMQWQENQQDGITELVWTESESIKLNFEFLYHIDFCYFIKCYRIVTQTN